ncbi:MAG: hypothetical protein AAF484_03600 [Pseudomonadota bacterium]
MTKKVVLVGWHPDAVDFDKWPGLTPEKLLNALESDRDRLRDDGFEVDLCLLRSTQSALDDVRTALMDGACDIVLIGAGVRRDEDHALTFEALINTVRDLAPQARFAFNTNPNDTRDAVLRWA